MSLNGADGENSTAAGKSERKKLFRPHITVILKAWENGRADLEGL